MCEKFCSIQYPRCSWAWHWAPRILADWFYCQIRLFIYFQFELHAFTWTVSLLRDCTLYIFVIYLRGAFFTQCTATDLFGNGDHSSVQHFPDLCWSGPACWRGRTNTSPLLRCQRETSDRLHCFSCWIYILFNHVFARETTLHIQRL